MLLTARLIPVFLLLIAASGSSSPQQWVPVTAKMRGMFETTKDGTTAVEKREGVFFRSADGSMLKYWVSVNGDESRGGSGQLFDNKNLFHYSINFHQRVAYQSRRRNPKRVDPADFSSNLANSSLGNDLVEGMQCRRVPVIVLWPDGRREVIGEHCVSLDYALTLREESRATQNHVTRHVKIELYDIQLGVEPDAKLFDIENSYTVFRPESPPAK